MALDSGRRFHRFSFLPSMVLFSAICDIMDKLESEKTWELNEIKGCVLSLVSAGCFMREPEDARLSEQKLSKDTDNQVPQEELLGEENKTFEVP